MFGWDEKWKNEKWSLDEFIIIYLKQKVTHVLLKNFGMDTSNLKERKKRAQAKGSKTDEWK